VAFFTLAIWNPFGMELELAPSLQVDH